tara:strand:- start:3448 stop:4719 length:1272 start_codon:yes stop_codon:yes gene_type:complete
MSSPSRSEVETQISNIVAILDHFRKYAGVNSDNFIDDEDTLVQSLETDYAAETMNAVSGFRSSLVGAINSGASMMSPLFLQMGQVIDAPETAIQTILTRLYEYMNDNSLAVTSRGFTYGAVSDPGTSNVGSGTVKRLTSDENAYAIENCTPEAKIAECVSDAHSGATKNEEVFQFRGSDAEKDSLKITGSGLTSQLRAVSARNSLTGNSSFSFYTGTTAAPTDINDWTVNGDIANFQIDTTNYYRDDPSDGGAPASLVFETNDYISQDFSVRNISINPNVPYYCSIAYNRQVGSGDGDLTLTCGDQTATVALSAQTGWNILEITMGQKSWLKTFNTSTPVVKVELASNTTGTVLVDDLIFTPFQLFDGLWYLPLGGATPFLRLDDFTWTDSATESVLQFWFWKSLGRYLPHATGGSVTWADPS